MPDKYHRKTQLLDKTTHDSYRCKNLSSCLSACYLNAAIPCRIAYCTMKLTRTGDSMRQNIDNRINKKAVLSQRWPRDARYISRSWAVAEIWPFEIIQDGGGRHLEFVGIENSAIRSAVPENLTIEPNMKWIGSPVAEIWPFAYVGAIWNPHFGGKRRS